MGNARKPPFRVVVFDEQQAFRRLVRNGQLLTEEMFRRQRGVTPSRLARLSASGSVFSVDVDGVGHYPAALVDPAYNRQRLARVCRILWPAPPCARLMFLFRKSAALGKVTPLQALDDDYERLLIVARGWTAEYSRTEVTIREGSASGKTALPLICMAFNEIDPRLNMYRRAYGALQPDWNIFPTKRHPPFPKLNVATVYIACSSVPGPDRRREARLDVTVKSGYARGVIALPGRTSYEVCPVRVADDDDIVNVVRKLLAWNARKSRRTGQSI